MGIPRQALFNSQYGLGADAYQHYATELGMDLAAFDDCVSYRRFQAEVRIDFEFAAELGVRSTPMFFVNGITIVGTQPFELFQQVIERELAGEIP